MPRIAANTFTLPDGTPVGYSLSDRGGVYRLSFNKPDGSRAQASTGKRTLADAHTEASKIIREAYSEHAAPVAATWDIAISEVERTSKLRPDTLRCYRCVIAAVRKLFPSLAGPADVDQQTAQLFKRRYLATGTAVSCRTYLRALRSLWQAHFRELGYVKSNPWIDVAYPEVAAKQVKIPPEEHISALFSWLSSKPIARLFVQVKALAGCRTWDLCQARSEHLRDGTLVLSREASKTYRERVIPLPADLFAELDSVKGGTWLWESYAGRFETFNPKTFYWFITNVFREYNEANPGARVKPHDLRKRAITLVTLATGSVDATAQAIGVDPQTARRYYLDAKSAFDGQDTLRKMQDVLRVKT